MQQVYTNLQLMTLQIATRKTVAFLTEFKRSEFYATLSDKEKYMVESLNDQYREQVASGRAKRPGQTIKFLLATNDNLDVLYTALRLFLASFERELDSDDINQKFGNVLRGDRYGYLNSIANFVKSAYGNHADIVAIAERKENGVLNKGIMSASDRADVIESLLDFVDTHIITDEVAYALILLGNQNLTVPNLP